MEVYISKQIAVMLYSLLLGAYLSLVFDVFRVIRIAIKHSNTVVLIEDIIYCAIALITGILFLSEYNDGGFRAYILIAATVGFFVCHCTLGKFIMIQAKLILRLVRLIMRLIFAPIRLILRLICKLFKKIRLFLKKPFIFLKKQVIILKSRLCAEYKKSRSVHKRGNIAKKRHKPHRKNSFRPLSSIPFIHIYRSSGEDKRKERTTQ